MDYTVTLIEIKNKDHLAFRKLFNELYPKLVLYANIYLFDEAASEDVVQEVFVHLWEKSDTIKIQKSLQAFLYTMVRNRCLNTLKAIKITDTLKILETQASFSLDYSPEWFLENEKNALYEQVRNTLENLPKKMRAIVKLRFIENYRYNEIADELGVSVNTVKTQLKRAKVKFGKLVVSIASIFSLFQ